MDRQIRKLSGLFGPDVSQQDFRLALIRGRKNIDAACGILLERGFKLHADGGAPDIPVEAVRSSTHSAEIQQPKQSKQPTQQPMLARPVGISSLTVSHMAGVAQKSVSAAAGPSAWVAQWQRNKKRAEKQRDMMRSFVQPSSSTTETSGDAGKTGASAAPANGQPGAVLDLASAPAGLSATSGNWQTPQGNAPEGGDTAVGIRVGRPLPPSVPPNELRAVEGRLGLRAHTGIIGPFCLELVNKYLQWPGDRCPFSSGQPLAFWTEGAGRPATAAGPPIGSRRTASLAAAENGNVQAQEQAHDGAAAENALAAAPLPARFVPWAHVRKEDADATARAAGFDAGLGPGAAARMKMKSKISSRIVSGTMDDSSFEGSASLQHAVLPCLPLEGTNLAWLYARRNLQRPAMSSRAPGSVSATDTVFGGSRPSKAGSGAGGGRSGNRIARGVRGSASAVRGPVKLYWGEQHGSRVGVFPGEVATVLGEALAVGLLGIVGHVETVPDEVPRLRGRIEARCWLLLAPEAYPLLQASALGKLQEQSALATALAAATSRLSDDLLSAEMQRAGLSSVKDAGEGTSAGVGGHGKNLGRGGLKPGGSVSVSAARQKVLQLAATGLSDDVFAAVFASLHGRMPPRPQSEGTHGSGADSTAGAGASTAGGLKRKKKRGRFGILAQKAGDGDDNDGDSRGQEDEEQRQQVADAEAAADAEAVQGNASSSTENDGEESTGGLDKLQLAQNALPESSQPQNVTGLSLRPYQAQGLGWMLQREAIGHAEALTRRPDQSSSVRTGKIPRARAGAEAGVGAGIGASVAMETDDVGEDKEHEDGGMDRQDDEGTTGERNGSTDTATATFMALPPTAMQCSYNQLWEVHGNTLGTRCFSVEPTSSATSDDTASKSGSIAKSLAVSSSDVVPQSLFVSPYLRRISRFAPDRARQCRGGLLCDAMGLGKTIQVLSLVVGDKERMLRASGAHGIPEGVVLRPAHASTATLVVVPLSLLQQWKEELERFSTPGFVKVRLHYGANRAKLPQALVGGTRVAPSRAGGRHGRGRRGQAVTAQGFDHDPDWAGVDVVITTYGTLVSEFLVAQREEASAVSRVVRGKGKVGKGGKRGRGVEVARGVKGGIASVGTFSRWDADQERFLRTLDQLDDAGAGIDHRSGGGAAGANGDEEAARGISWPGSDERGLDPACPAGAPLLGVRWRRIVLDEGHVIRNRMTLSAKACLAVRSLFRWCLTGTPIQNTLDDVHALLQFLGHEPWNDPTWWKSVVSEPFARGDQGSIATVRKVLGPLLLRRTKDMRDVDGRPIVAMQPRRNVTTLCGLRGIEKRFYAQLKARSVQTFEGFVAGGSINRRYLEILILLLRMRQACDHPFLALQEQRNASHGSASGGRSQGKGGPNVVDGGGTSSGTGSGNGNGSGSTSSSKGPQSGDHALAGALAVRSGAGSSSSSSSQPQRRIPQAQMLTLLKRVMIANGILLPGESAHQAALRLMVQRASRAREGKGTTQGEQGTAAETEASADGVDNGHGSAVNSPERAQGVSSSSTIAAEARTSVRALAEKELPSYTWDALSALERQGLDAIECPVCMDAPDMPVITPCAHVFCQACLLHALKHRGRNACPACRRVVLPQHTTPIEMDGSSSRFAGLVHGAWVSVGGTGLYQDDGLGNQAESNSRGNDKDGREGEMERGGAGKGDVSGSGAQSSVRDSTPGDTLTRQELQLKMEEEYERIEKGGILRAPRKRPKLSFFASTKLQKLCIDVWACHEHNIRSRCRRGVRDWVISRSKELSRTGRGRGLTQVTSDSNSDIGRSGVEVIGTSAIDEPESSNDGIPAAGAGSPASTSSLISDALGGKLDAGDRINFDAPTDASHRQSTRSKRRRTGERSTASSGTRSSGGRALRPRGTVPTNGDAFTWNRTHLKPPTKYMNSLESPMPSLAVGRRRSPRVAAMASLQARTTAAWRDGMGGSSTTQGHNSNEAHNNERENGSSSDIGEEDDDEDDDADDADDAEDEDEEDEDEEDEDEEDEDEDEDEAGDHRGQQLPDDKDDGDFEASENEDEDEDESDKRNGDGSDDAGSVVDMLASDGEASSVFDLSPVRPPVSLSASKGLLGRAARESRRELASCGATPLAGSKRARSNARTSYAVAPSYTGKQTEVLDTSSPVALAGDPDVNSIGYSAAFDNPDAGSTGNGSFPGALGAAFGVAAGREGPAADVWPVPQRCWNQAVGEAMQALGVSALHCSGMSPLPIVCTHLQAILSEMVPGSALSDQTQIMFLPDEGRMAPGLRTGRRDHPVALTPTASMAMDEVMADDAAVQDTSASDTSHGIASNDGNDGNNGNNGNGASEGDKIPSPHAGSAVVYLTERFGAMPDDASEIEAETEAEIGGDLVRGRSTPRGTDTTGGGRGGGSNDTHYTGGVQENGSQSALLPAPPSLLADEVYDEASALAGPGPGSDKVNVGKTQAEATRTTVTAPEWLRPSSDCLVLNGEEGADRDSDSDSEPSPMVLVTREQLALWTDPVKVVAFSQFTHMLDMAEAAMRKCRCIAGGGLTADLIAAGAGTVDDIEHGRSALSGDSCAVDGDEAALGRNGSSGTTQRHRLAGNNDTQVHGGAATAWNGESGDSTGSGRLSAAPGMASASIETNGKATTSERGLLEVPECAAPMIQQLLRALEAGLSTESLQCRRLDGSMAIPQRTAQLGQFKASPCVPLMLISTKAGGVGLNISEACVAVMLDPWWNAAVEEQAVNRIHRLGQPRTVTVKRYIIDGSVEGSMLRIQERKQKVADAALAPGGKAQSSRMLSSDELVALFRGGL